MEGLPCHFGGVAQRVAYGPGPATKSPHEGIQSNVEHHDAVNSSFTRLSEVVSRYLFLNNVGRTLDIGSLTSPIIMCTIKGSSLYLMHTRRSSQAFAKRIRHALRLFKLLKVNKCL